MVGAVAAAQNPYEFFYNNAPSEHEVRLPDPDNRLFALPLDRGRIFSDYDFSFVKYTWRGTPEWVRDGRMGHTPDYRLLNILKPIADGWRISGSGFDRRGRFGVRGSWGGDGGGVAFSHRAGRDPHVGGVFLDETSGVVRADLRHGFSAMVAAVRAENGLRSYATREAFELTGNKLYNPSWGMYGDRERSGRTVSRAGGVASLDYAHAAGDSEWTGALSFRASRSKRGGLMWFDAAVPYPDYYRYMPGYEPTNPADGWLGDDRRVTQIFWEQLVEQNLNRGGEAAYVVEGRVEQAVEIGANIAGKTVLGNGWTASYSAGFRQDRKTRHKVVEDLLGARPFRDADSYLLGDEVFGDLILNDLQNPGRMVGPGDRFGYFYHLTTRSFDLRAGVEYRYGGLLLSGGMQVGGHSLWREGGYEKELFPGALSLGKSRILNFAPYSLEASAGYDLSARHGVDIELRHARIAPSAGSIFLNPDYHNGTIAQPGQAGVFSVEARYTGLWDRADLSAAVFFTATDDESAVWRYWDDIESVYADMAVGGIDKRYLGIEAGGEWELWPKFSLRAVGTVGRYVYGSDAVVSVYEDATRERLFDGAVTRLRGYRLAGAPERAAKMELKYNTWGWIASLSASYAGGRWVEITPLRRMERAYGLAGSPERHAEFVDQEKLDDAFTLDLFVLRSFDLSDGRFTATVAVDNLLGMSTIYHGYEQMRIARSGVAPSYSWKPFQSKYLYNYGRTYHISATYAF